jgi:hypothetical protein
VNNRILPQFLGIDNGTFNNFEEDETKGKGS